MSLILPSSESEENELEIVERSSLPAFLTHLKTIPELAKVTSKTKRKKAVTTAEINALPLAEIEEQRKKRILSKIKPSRFPHLDTDLDTLEPTVYSFVKSSLSSSSSLES